MAGNIYIWDLTAGDNNDADPDINWMENQWPDTVNDSARMMMTRIAEWRSDITGALAAAGTANARTIANPNAKFDTLDNGRLITFRSALANTGATTLNVNGLGSKAIRKMGASGDVDLAAGDLLVSGVYIAIYSTTANANAGGWLLFAPYTNAYATLTATSATIGIGAYGSYSGAPISTLIGGTTAGALIEGGVAGHLALGIRDNDTNDSVSIVSYNGTGAYSKLVAAFRANGATVLDGVSASTLAVSGAATVGGNKVDAFPAGTRMLFQQTAAPTGWTKDTTFNDRALRVVNGTVGSANVGSPFSSFFSTDHPIDGDTEGASVSGTTGSTVLTTAQIPAHTHGPGTLAGVAASAGAHTHGPGTLIGVTNSAGAHTHNFNITAGGVTSGISGVTGSINEGATFQSAPGSQSFRTFTIGSNGAHTHTIDVNAGATASGGAHTHTVDVNAGATASAGTGGGHTHTFNAGAHFHELHIAQDFRIHYVDVIICQKAA